MVITRLASQDGTSLFFLLLRFSFETGSFASEPIDLICLLQVFCFLGFTSWTSSSSSSSSSCLVVGSSTSSLAFSFGFLLRLHRCLRFRLRLVSSFNGASRSPSSGFVSIISAIKIALMQSSSGSSRHPLLPVPLILFILFITSCVLGVMILIGDRCAVDLCLWAQEI